MFKYCFKEYILATFAFGLVHFHILNGLKLMQKSISYTEYLGVAEHILIKHSIWE